MDGRWEFLHQSPYNYSPSHSPAPMFSSPISHFSLDVIAMSATEISTVVNLWRKKGYSPSSLLSPPRTAPPVASNHLPPSTPPGTLQLVRCPYCQTRTTIHLVSKSEANPECVFYKCPNHRDSCNIQSIWISMLKPFFSATG